MLDSYFFIPGDKQKYLDKIDTINSDFIIIDLEDAVSGQNKQDALDLVMLLTVKDNYYIRIPFFEDCFTDNQIISLIKLFKGRVVVPKLVESSQLQAISDLVPDFNLDMIILVENPTCFINLEEILKSFSKQIHGVGFGSHDFCSLIGMKHTFENLVQYKRQLILYVKAFNVNYLDGVDLNLIDFTEFKNESKFAFEIGASGKFLIHPKQIIALQEVDYLTDEEVAQLNIVYDKIKDIPNDSIEVYTINGKVYEKPHIQRIKKIMQKKVKLIKK